LACDDQLLKAHLHLHLLLRLLLLHLRHLLLMRLPLRVLGFLFLLTWLPQDPGRL
jgi:hypothetical protein